MNDETPRAFLTEILFRAKTYDIDFAGIVSNIVYIRWLEDLRLQLLDGSWPLDQQLRDGYTAVLLSTDIQYKRALRLFEQPLGRIWVSGMSNARFTMQSEFMLDGEVTTSAIQTCAFVRTDTFRPVRIPPNMRDAYEQALKGTPE